ncbi:MAG: SCO family protein [Steroidobacteraceae bacterium]
MRKAMHVAACLLAFSLPYAAITLAEPLDAGPLPRDSVYQLPVSLTDQDGQLREWQSFRGKPRLVAMFYTSCQYICPLIIDAAKSVERNLTPQQLQNLGVVFISMDPARDTPSVLKEIAAKRRINTSRWTLVAPPLADVREIAAVLNVRYRQLADGEFNHTSALTLLDADGRVLARTEQMGAKGDPDFLQAARRATDGGP